MWNAPTFSTPAPVPQCSDTMCPGLHDETCTDSAGVTYGVLCDTRFSGIVITNSGKKYLMEREEDFKRIAEEEKYAGVKKRDYAGTFDNCVGFCDTYESSVSVPVRTMCRVCTDPSLL